MELNEKGEIIQEPKKERLMGKLLNKTKKQENSNVEPVKETKEVKEEPVKKEQEDSSEEITKEQITRLAFAYLNYTELIELARIKVGQLEKENIELTQLLKKSFLNKKEGE